MKSCGEMWWLAAGDWESIAHCFEYFIQVFPIQKGYDYEEAIPFHINENLWIMKIYLIS